MGVSPFEHLLITLGFHLTKLPTFSMDLIRNGLQVALACAESAESPAEFRALLESRATQVHHVYDLNAPSQNGHRT